MGFAVYSQRFRQTSTHNHSQGAALKLLLLPSPSPSVLAVHSGTGMLPVNIEQLALSMRLSFTFLPRCLCPESARCSCDTSTIARAEAKREGGRAR